MQFSSDMPVQRGQVIEGKYRVDRVLGLGGMGVVVLATHLVLEQQVAMKFLLPAVATNDEVVRRFIREARAASKIRSEHVARIMDVSGTDSELPFLVMEYLHGDDLSAVVKQQGPLPVRDAVGYVLQACEALAEAHAQGIVHRDLKPANLFRTTRADGTHCVKVLDFGISKVAVAGETSSLTHTRGMMGSPLYMSPEQARSARNATTRSDIWSIGVVLYELFTGTTPFQGESVMELCADLLNKFPPPPSFLRPDLPEGLDAVVMKCIEKEPANRFNNVAELAGALAPFGVAGAWESARVTARVLGLHPRARAERIVEIPPTERTPVPPNPTLPEASPLPEPQLHTGETVGSWGATHRTSRSKRTPMAILAAAAIAVTLVGAGLWWRSTSNRSTGSTGSFSAEQVGLVTSTTPGLVAPEPTLEVESPPSDSTTTVASSSATPAGSASLPPRALSPRAAPPARPPVVRAASPSVQPATQKEEPTKKEEPAPKSDLDLFNDNK